MKFSFFSLVASVLVMVSVSCKSDASKLTPVLLKTEYKKQPVIEETSPRFSWILEDDVRGQKQTAYRVIVASNLDLLSNDNPDFWDSEKVNSDQMSQLVYKGKELEITSSYYWKVQVWDAKGNPGPWSEVASFETGLMGNENWKAKWIGYDLTELGKGRVYHLPPVPYLRKEISLKENIKKAKLYVTSLGVYEFLINGDKVGDDYLNPGWTNYNKRVHYQTYDVKDKLVSGENALGSILSYGWYSGYLGYALLVGLPQVKNFYGDVPCLLAQLEVEYENGEKEYFITDASWKASDGPLIESDILQGETYDARLELTGWSKTGYDDNTWKEVDEYQFSDMKIQVHPGEAIRLIERVKPVNITERPEGYIFDLGQNFAGIIKLKVKGKKGDKLVLKYGEMLYPDGSLMTENLRRARATDTYILKGDPEGEMWQPRFTFHGFRYVQLTGYEGMPDEETITGLVLSSDHEKTSSFLCGDTIINKLYENINWTQLSNFLDVPTDCPQRDERLGWTGDAQVYMKSATINRDVASFFTKWLQDLNDDQWESGAYPNFAPTPYIRDNYVFSPAWGEAGIICTYEMYKAYGDTRIIKKFWPNMERFMSFYTKRAGDNYVFEEASFEDIIPKGGFGDWLSIGKKTPPDMLASFYYAYCAEMMVEMAEATGNTEDQQYYSDMFEKIRTGILNHYGGPDNTFACNASAYGNGAGYVDGKLGFDAHTQTTYANAIYMDLLNSNEKGFAGKYLAELIRKNDGKLTVGFLGSKPLLPALSETGNSKIAYDLFLSKEYPSWGFEVVNGATTIWERWNSYTHENGFGGEQNASMNSFNHYAFGAVCEWMYEYAAGIKSTSPAYRTIEIKPEPDKRLQHLRAEYNSISGKITSAWRYDGEALIMEVQIPVNVSGTIFLPSGSEDLITEGGKPLAEAEGLKVEGIDNDYVEVLAGSGNYSFIIKPDNP